MALTSVQRAQVQEVYNLILYSLQNKYGPTVELEFSKTTAKNGVLTGLTVAFRFEGAPDPDGIRPLIRREVDVW